MLRSETVTSQKKYATCDFCGERLTKRYRCPGCGKDVCPQCGHWWFQNPFTLEDYGDYPPLACKRCNTLASLIAPEAVQIQREADEKIKAIQAKWESKCLSKELQGL